MFIKRGCGEYYEGPGYKTVIPLQEIALMLEEAKAEGIDIGDIMIGTKDDFLFFDPQRAKDIPFSRDFRPFDSKKYIQDLPRLRGCYYAKVNGNWLHWIGRKYYTLVSFQKEAYRFGISRRVKLTTLKKMNWKDTVYLIIRKNKTKSGYIFGKFRITRLQGLTDEVIRYLNKRGVLSGKHERLQVYRNYKLAS